MTRPLLRKLGDGGALFDPATWQTRVLTPAAVIIVEALAELGELEYPLPKSRALEYLRTELEIDTDSPSMQQVLRSLQEMGMLGG